MIRRDRSVPKLRSLLFFLLTSHGGGELPWIHASLRRARAIGPPLDSRFRVIRRDGESRSITTPSSMTDVACTIGDQGRQDAWWRIGLSLHDQAGSAGGVVCEQALSLTSEKFYEQMRWRTVLGLKAQGNPAEDAVETGGWSGHGIPTAICSLGLLPRVRKRPDPQGRATAHWGRARMGHRCINFYAEGSRDDHA